MLYFKSNSKNLEDNTKQFQKRTYTNDKYANKKALIYC